MYSIRVIALIIVALVAMPANSDDSVPFIYFYSDNSIVVERADQTGTHHFADDVLETNPDYIVGSGWSPNSENFVFATRPYGRPNGYILNPKTSSAHPINLWRIGAMDWSPNGDYLLVSGNIDPCEGYCSHVTNWLLDTRSGDILAWLDIRRGARSPGNTPIIWDKDAVTFFRFEETFPHSRLSGYYQIHMSSDGEVTKYPITAETYQEHFTPLDESAERIEIFSSPSGRYSLSATGLLADTQEQSSIQLPEPDFGFDGTPHIYDAQWHPSENWILLFYNIWSGGIDGVSIVKRDGSQYRTLTTCDGSLSCVGWLPESAELTNFTPYPSQ